MIHMPYTPLVTVFGLIVGILDRHFYDDFAGDGKEVEEVDVSD